MPIDLILLFQAETYWMGIKCCKQTTEYDRIMESDGKPSIGDYREEPWPSDNNFILKQLENSKIVNINSGSKPLKHKTYNQWYWGDWNHGRPKGKGVLYNRQGKRHIYYEGEFDGQPNGRGKVIFNQGQYEYEGDIKDSRATGHGRMKNNKQGYQFDGIWKDSKMHKGNLIIRPDTGGLFGSKNYQGDTIVQIDDEKHENVIRYPDGRVYVGEVDKNKFVPDGKGKVSFPNGGEYIGEWKDGQMHGEGEFTWKDGSSYRGEYYHNRKHGKGNFIFPTGNRYEGYWEKGVQHGKGILYSKNGTQLESGEWENGKFIGQKRKSIIF